MDPGGDTSPVDDWNNYGVECIRLGALSEAVGSFRHALKIANDGLCIPTYDNGARGDAMELIRNRCSPNVAMAFNNANSARSAHHANPDAGVEDDKLGAAASAVREVLSEVSDNLACARFGRRGTLENFLNSVRAPNHDFCLYLHSEGILLNQRELFPTNGTADGTMAQLTVSCCVVLYNLALTYQLQGTTIIDGSLEEQRCLQKASSLYQRVGLLLEQAGFSTAMASGHATVDFLVMSTLNNMGYASHELSNHKASKACFACCFAFAASLDRVLHRTQQLYVGESSTDVALISIHSIVARLLQMHKSAYLLNALSLEQPRHSSAA